MGFFRMEPSHDYLAISEYGENEEEAGITLCFGNWMEPPGFLYWMANLTIGKQARDLAVQLTKEHGLFETVQGWNPRTVIDDEPNALERQIFQGRIDEIVARELEDADDFWKAA